MGTGGISISRCSTCRSRQCPSTLSLRTVRQCASANGRQTSAARSLRIVPYRHHRDHDRIANNHHWQRLCEVLDLPALATEAKFATNRDRVDHRDELASLIENVTHTQPAEFWLSRLNAGGIPCGQINAVNDLFDEPQVRHRNMLIPLEHPVLGTVTVPGIPWKLVPPDEEEPPTAPPTLGQHTEQILHGLGYSASEIQTFRRTGVPDP